MNEMTKISIPEGDETPQHSSSFIKKLLDEVQQGSTLRIYARSGSSWAEMYGAIENCINSKNVKIEVVLASPNAVMATGNDHGKFDIASAVDKFKLIKVSQTSSAHFQLSLNPTFLLFSYVAWIDKSGIKHGLLTIGATLNKHDQKSIQFSKDSIFRNNLDRIYEKTAISSKQVILKNNTEDHIEKIPKLGQKLSLDTPEKLTIPWLWENVNIKTLVTVIAIILMLISAFFSFGYKVHQKGGLAKALETILIDKIEENPNNKNQPTAGSGG